MSEDLDLSLQDDEVDQLEDESGDASTEPADGPDLDAELSKLGVSPLPDETPDAVKEALIERFKTYQRGVTPKLERAAALEREVSRLQGQVEAIQRGSTPPAKDGPPEGANDEQILEFYIDKVLARKVTPILDRMNGYIGRNELSLLKGRYTDWDEHEAQIITKMQSHPTLTGDEAYTLVTGKNVPAMVEKLASEKLRQKKSVGGKPTTAGGTSPKVLDLADVRKLTDDQAFEMAYQAALKEARSKDKS